MQQKIQADRRIFTVPVANTVTFSNITVRYGKVGEAWLSVYGGGIQVSGTSTIDKCDISYNRAPGGGGGGVDVTGSLTVQNSAIHNNVAKSMGGGLNRNGSSGSGGAPGASDLLHVINSTISNNQVTATMGYFEGGGVFFRRGSGTITNSTISYNTVVSGGYTSSHGVGTGDAGSTVSLKNNIIANNTLTNCYSGEIGHWQAGEGTYTDNGGNIFGKLGNNIDGMTVSTTSWVDQDDGCTSPDGTFLLQDGGATTGTINQNSTLALNNSLYGTMSHAITADSGIEIDNVLTGTME
jgi:hypothetical protein